MAFFIPEYLLKDKAMESFVLAMDLINTETTQK